MLPHRAEEHRSYSYSCSCSYSAIGKSSSVIGSRPLADLSRSSPASRERKLPEAATAAATGCFRTRREGACALRLTRVLPHRGKKEPKNPHPGQNLFRPAGFYWAKGRLGRSGPPADRKARTGELAGTNPAAGPSLVGFPGGGDVPRGHSAPPPFFLAFFRKIGQKRSKQASLLPAGQRLTGTAPARPPWSTGQRRLPPGEKDTARHLGSRALVENQRTA